MQYYYLGFLFCEKGDRMKKLLEALTYSVVALAIVYVNFWLIAAIIRLVRG